MSRIDFKVRHTNTEINVLLVPSKSILSYLLKEMCKLIKYIYF